MEEKVDDKKPETEDKNENVAMAVLAYFFFFIPLLTDYKDDPFVKFHVKQSLLLFCVNMATYILRIVMGRIMWAITPLISTAVFVLFVIGLINAVNKETKELPIIGKYADKIFKF